MTLALAGAQPRARGGTGRAFARVECCADPAAARSAWDELASAGGGYQGYAFVAAWAQAFAARLAIIVARDAAGEPVALLPLHVRRFGPLRIARFAGDAWANYQMGLFRRGLDWGADDTAALLGDAARLAGVDLLALSNQPVRWAGLDNPLARLPGRRSPSAAFASALPRTHADWLGAHFSRATQKKWRKKARKLEALGALAYARAGAGAEAQGFLDALFAHKAALGRARGEPDEFARAEVRDLLRRLCGAGAMEMHALKVGERVVATFGALSGGRRLSGLVVSYDCAPETAAATPGELLLIEVVRDAIARGFETFDLGVGESRYKSEICEIEEALTDAAFAATPLGRLAAPVYLGARAVLGWLKRRPRWLQLARRLRRVV